MDIKGANSAKQEAFDVTEQAREEEWANRSFLGELFMGRISLDLIHPYPTQPSADKKIGDDYLKIIEAFLKENVNPDEIDQTGQMPGHVLKGLANLGAFGMKIPREYGGLGLSQVNYNRVAALLASYCGSTAVFISAHQSIGVPQPLKLFGTPEQKKKYLPRLAAGALSAFALTEPSVGSDPAKMETTATPTADGKHFIIHGEKLWCTNGPDAELLVVMCRTPSKIIGGKEKKQITAFIVETNSPGFEVVHRCSFMGLKAISNGLLRFNNVLVPRENIIWGEGLGLKLAFMTLNQGRLTLPAACLGAVKQCIHITRKWANDRVQWGSPIGYHDFVAGKIADMSAGAFAMESITWLTSQMVDRGECDIRLEAALCKLFCTETGWKIVDDALQIRGGRGYETADSLRNRGEPPYAMERMMRDFRINLLIEGSSEILRLFIAREALDPHMQIAKDFLDPKSLTLKKFKAIIRMTAFYSRWYPARWMTFKSFFKYGLFGTLASHLCFVERQANHLARAIFHSMVRYQGALEQKQRVLGRLVNIGGELFAMSATCSRALMLVYKNKQDKTPMELADLFCRQSRRRIKHSFSALSSNNDVDEYSLARKMLKGELTWMEEGIMKKNIFENDKEVLQTLTHEALSI